MKVNTLPKPVKTKKVKKVKKVSEYKNLELECLAIWSKCVKARDKVCRYTNMDYGLQAHHIRSVSHHSTMFLIDNGLTLSNKIHCLQHYSPELFQDKVIDIIGNDFYEELKRKSLIPIKWSVEDLKQMKKCLTEKLRELQNG